MMKMKKRVVFLVLAAALAVTATGCGKKEEAVQSDLKKGVVEYPIQTEEKLTYWCSLPSQVSSVVSNFGETPFAQSLREATGIEVEYVHPAQGQENALDLLIASGDMPDMVFSQWFMKNPQSCIDKGIIYNLDEFVDDYAPNLKKYLDENPNVKKDVVTDAKNVYVFPFVRGEKSLCAVSGFMMRADWLKDAGLSVPKTIDDWDKVLAAFKEKCNVPFATNRYDMLAGGFGAFPAEYLKDGKIKYGPMEPEYRDMLAKLSEWYQKGYIDKSFAIADAKLVDSNMLNGESGITFGTGGSKMGTYLASGKGSGYDLVAVPYPAERADEKSKYSGIEWQYTTLGAAITKNCKNPALAARYLDYGYTEEGHMLYNFGKEGESYTMVDGYPKYADKLLDSTDGTPVAQKLTMNCLGAESGPFIQDRRYIEQYYGTDRQRDAIVQWADNDYYDYKIPHLLMTTEENAECSEIMTEIETYVNEYFNKTIIGKSSIDEFDSFVEKLKSMGIERALEIRQAAYDRRAQK